MTFDISKIWRKVSQRARLFHGDVMTLQFGQSFKYPAVINGVIRNINNLALKEGHQKRLKEYIPTLISLSEEKPHEVILPLSPSTLISPSLQPDSHEPYTKLIQQMFEYLDLGTTGVIIQALRVLGSFSGSRDMVPHLLAAKAPACMYDLLSPDTDAEILIYWTTILANVMCVVKDSGMTSGSLPTEYKAPSPETTFTALYGHDSSNKLRSKVFVLSRHQDRDVRHQSARIYGCLT